MLHLRALDGAYMWISDKLTLNHQNSILPSCYLQLAVAMDHDGDILSSEAYKVGAMFRCGDG